MEVELGLSLQQSRSKRDKQMARQPKDVLHPQLQQFQSVLQQQI